MHDIFLSKNLGEWEAMQNPDDNSKEGSSNLDMVTVHPDVSDIDITTPKPRSYKDISSLRSKKYQSFYPSKSRRQNELRYEDSKAADIQIIPQTTRNRYYGENDSENPSDGSLYSRYHDTLVSGYTDELNSDKNMGDEYFDPMEEMEGSMRYNPPSFNNDESDDNEANSPHPDKRKKVEETYVKHNVREELLEGVRSNSFRPQEDGEDYPEESSFYNPPKHIDDYAAPIKPAQGPKNHYRKVKSFRQNPTQGNPFLQGLVAKTPYEDYDQKSPAELEDSSSPTKPYNGPPRNNYVKQGQNHPKKFHPGPRRPPSTYGRHRKFPSGVYREYRSKSQHDSHHRVPYQNVAVFPVSSSSGGIRVVPPPRIRAPPPRHGKSPYYSNGIRSSPYARSQRMIYRRTIPQKDGFTKIVKKYQSFSDHGPKIQIRSRDT